MNAPDIRAVVFDLDGTLLDTLADLASSMNAALRELGLPEHPRDSYRRYVGDGLGMLVRRALPEVRRDDADLARRCTEGMRREYARRCLDETRAYDGAAELLAVLAGRGVPCCVFTNKPHEMAGLLLGRCFPGIGFHAVQGAADGVPRKPDPTAALAMARGLGLPPASVAFVGDSDTDMHTARNAGMLPCGALWGFRDREELLAAGAARLLSAPLDLLGLIEAAGQ